MWIPMMLEPLSNILKQLLVMLKITQGRGPISCNIGFGTISNNLAEVYPLLRGIQLAKELWSRPLIVFWRFTGDYQSHDQLLSPVNSKIAMVLARVRE